MSQHMRFWYLSRICALNTTVVNSWPASVVCCYQLQPVRPDDIPERILGNVIFSLKKSDSR